MEFHGWPATEINGEASASDAWLVAVQLLGG
jgi:hypothetical protein